MVVCGHNFSVNLVFYHLNCFSVEVSRRVIPKIEKTSG